MRLWLEEFDRRHEAGPPSLRRAPKLERAPSGPVWMRTLPAFLCYSLALRPTRTGRHAPSGEGEKMSTKTATSTRQQILTASSAAPTADRRLERL